MNLSPNMKNDLAEETQFVVGQMKKAAHPTEKLYFFSAVFGMAQRILNFEYDPELTFIHQVTQLVYNTINTRVAMMASGQETPISFPNNLFTELEDSLEKLAVNIREGTVTYPTLQRMVNLAYSTTGNGYYLYVKGKLTV